MTIAPPCSAALPTIATTTTAMKNSLRPTAVAKAWSEWTRISLTQAVAAGRGAEGDERDGHRPRVRGSAAFARRCPVAMEVPSDDGDVDEQQHDRDRHGRDDRGVSLGRSGVADRGGDREARRRPAPTRPICTSSERRSISFPSGPAICVTPNTSRRFEMTLPASEPRTTTGRFASIAKSATMSSGAFPKLALRKPPMPGPVCSAACSVADQPRERDERERREEDAQRSFVPSDYRRPVERFDGEHASFEWDERRSAHRALLATIRSSPRPTRRQRPVRTRAGRARSSRPGS